MKTRYQQSQCQQYEDQTNKHTLKNAVAKIIKTNNFHSASPSVLDTLTDIAQKTLFHLSSNSKGFAEISQRIQISDKDVMLTLLQMNVDVGGLVEFINGRSRSKTQNVAQDTIQNDTKATKTTAVDDSVPLPSIQSPKRDPEILSIIPKKKPNHFPVTMANAPDLPDLQTFKRTACFVHQNEDYGKIRNDRADRKLAGMRNLAGLMAKSEYYSGKGTKALSLFNEQEVVHADSSDALVIDAKRQRTDDEIENDTNSHSWQVLPILLNKPNRNSTVSVYSQALIPTKSETDLLLDTDPFLAKKKPLRPKKEVKKADGRSSRHLRKDR